MELGGLEMPLAIREGSAADVEHSYADDFRRPFQKDGISRHDLAALTENAVFAERRFNCRILAGPLMLDDVLMKGLALRIVEIGVVNSPNPRRRRCDQLLDREATGPPHRQKHHGNNQYPGSTADVKKHPSEIAHDLPARSVSMALISAKDTAARAKPNVPCSATSRAARRKAP